MLLVSEIINNVDKISSLMSKRNIDVKSKLDKIIETDKLRRSTQSSLDDILSESNKLAKDIGSLFKWEIEMFGEEGKPEVNPDKLPPTLAEKAREDALADETATRYSREDGEFGKTYSIKGGIKFKPRTDGFEAVVYGRLRSFNMLKVEWDELTVEQTQENSDTFLCMSLEEALSEQWYLRANSRIPLNGDRTCFGGVSLSRENKGKSAFSMRVTGGRFPEDSDNSDEHDAYQTEVRFHISYTRLF